ncbi:MAG: adenylate/guanylate cyclase domain-containing protein, partial [Gammaproteobacteria bacterium]|nr:adenylate/guanylate cyclase domain-containing protein [Gammaproteobacteria bacterium]
RWPWTRAVHAQLLEGLLAQEPRAVVFDIVLSDANRADPAGDERLIDAALPADNVFFPMVVLSEQEGRKVNVGKRGYQLGFEPVGNSRGDATISATLPLEPLANTGRIGAINMLEDPDGIARRYYLHLDRAGWRIPSLPARVADYLDVSVPDKQSIQLHWNAGPYEREYYSYADVLAALEDPQDDRFDGLFTDTIVIIGGDAMGLYDLRVTPVSNAHPGADILATALGNLIQDDYLEPVSPLLGALLGLMLMAAIYLAFVSGRGLLVGGLLIPVTVIAWLILAEAALSANLILPVMPVIAFPILLFIGLGLEQTLRERAAREQAVSTFGRFIDPRVASSLVKEDSDLLDAPPQSREVTVLFSDIRGFTTLSETRAPEEIVSLLNRYFAQQVEVIFRHGGTIDKFIGDAIMAFWGAPADDPEQADNAVKASIEMVEVVQQFQKELEAEGIPFDIGIGLHTGPAVVGFIGSSNRLDYTVIGDTVNLASRIEGQTKGRARILVSEDTRARCRHEWTFRDHGSVTVKGRSAPVNLYEPR